MYLNTFFKFFICVSLSLCFFYPCIHSQEQEQNLVIIHDLKVNKIADQCEVDFNINQEYASILLDSEESHQFYEGMPLILHDTYLSDTDEFGKYFIIFTLENIETHEILTAQTKLLTDSNDFFPKKISWNQEAWHANAKDPKGWLYFTLNFILDGEDSYHSEQLQECIHSGANFDKAVNYKVITPLGDCYTILSETPLNENKRLSSFVISSIKSGKQLTVIGPYLKSRTLQTFPVSEKDPKDEKDLKD